MNQTFKEIATPWHPRGGYALPYAPVLIVLGLILAFLAGALTGERVENAGFFRSHYQAPLTVITRQKTAPRLNVALPTAASIKTSIYPAVADQKNLGSCAAWAAAWAMSYEYRLRHPGSWLRFSPRFLYSHFSDAQSGGRDDGSNFTSNIQQAAATGVPKFRQLPYPPEVIDNPLPYFDVNGASLQTDASRYKLAWSSHIMTEGQNEGQGVIDLIRAQIAAGHPVGIGFPVWREYDNAAAQPLITAPTAAEVQQEPQGRGGHENVVLAYNDFLRFPDGTVGGVWLQNQWTMAWGRGGRAWMSYDMLRRFVFETGSVSLGTPGVAAHFRYVRSHAPLHKAPISVPFPKTIKVTGGSVPQVYGVRTADTGVDLSAAINQSAAYYGFSAPGFAALMGVESGIRQYAPHYPVNGAGFCDYSAGLTQITVCTAAGLGVGDGSTSQANINYVFWYEQADPIRDVWMSARLVAQFREAVGWDFAPLYAAWNLGPGYGRFNDIYIHPTNYITQNAVASFNGWWNLIWARHVTYNPPPPRPKPKPQPHYRFPGGTWESYRIHHHLSRIPHTWHGKLSQAASVWWTVQGRKGRELCGGIVKPEVWHPHGPHGRDGFEKNVFQGCRILLWPNHRDWNPKIIRTRWKR